jgi:hypothetical protein
MVVQVKDALAGIGPGVDNHAKAALGDAMLVRKSRRDLEDLADERAVARFDIEDTYNMFARNNEDMHWRPGFNVVEGDHGIVAIDNLRLNLSINNAAK